MTDYSRKLGRQLKKALGNEDGAALLLDLARTLRTVPELAESPALPCLEHFPDFLAAVDEAYSQYEDRVNIAIRNIEISSVELNEVNLKLEQLNIAMSAMLESLGQGLLFFDREGVCSKVYSKACLDLLEGDPAGQHVSDVLKLDTDERDAVQSWISVVFDNDLAMDFEDLSAMAPDHYRHSGGLYISLRYRPMRQRDGSLRGILVIATDVTEEREARQRLKEQELAAIRVLRIVRNRNYLARFFQTCLTLKQELNAAPGSESITDEQIIRDLHTLKGVAGSFQFQELADRISRLEGIIRREEGKGTPLRDILRPHLPGLETVCDQAQATAQSILGGDVSGGGEIQNIPVTKLEAFLHRLDSVPELRQVFLRELLSVPVTDMLSVFAMQIQDLAESIGKKIHPCRFVGDTFSIRLAPYRGVQENLIHIARNIADHGIEVPYLRRERNKDEAAQITIITRAKSALLPDAFDVTIVDDGGGIDAKALRRKVEEREGEDAARALSDSQLFQKVFADRVSTASEGQAFSGQGVGLSAVRAEVERIGGKVRIDSEQGVGTRLTVSLPYIWE